MIAAALQRLTMYVVLCGLCVAMDGEQGCTPSSWSGLLAGGGAPLHIRMCHTVAHCAVHDGGVRHVCVHVVLHSSGLDLEGGCDPHYRVYTCRDFPSYNHRAIAYN